MWNINKLGSAVVAQGAKVYWDNGNKQCVTTASGNTLIGYAAEAAADGETTVQVQLRS